MCGLSVWQWGGQSSLNNNYKSQVTWGSYELSSQRPVTWAPATLSPLSLSDYFHRMRAIIASASLPGLVQSHTQWPRGSSLDG